MFALENFCAMRQMKGYVEYRCHLMKMRAVPVQGEFLQAVCLKTVELILLGSDFCDVIFVFH